MGIILLLFLTSDPDSNIYYWTSKEDAVGNSSEGWLVINWHSGNSKIADL